MSSFVLFLPLFVFLTMAAFFSLAETAIFASNRYKIAHLATQGNRRAQKLVSWLAAPEKLLATVLLGSNFANIGAATVSASIVSRWVRVDYIDFALAGEAVVLTIVLLLFCELGPKAIAARHPEKIGLGLVIPIEICMRLFYPVTKIGVRIAGFFFRSHKAEAKTHASPQPDFDLRTVIQAHRQEGSKMLERVLEFSERQVKDVMIPRMEVTALDISTPFDEILMIVESTRYSRFPVYQGVLDNVVGILHGKDLMPYLHYPKTFRLSQLLRKPVFIPDTAKLNNAVLMLQNAQTHLGIVVDEHGGMEGMVTLEDLIEQIVGEIQDEHDVEVDSIVPHPDGSVLIDASISVREFNERVGFSLPETGQYVTLAGFLLARAGRLLRESEEVEYEGSTFRVEQIMGRRIMRVRLIKAVPAVAPAEEHSEVEPRKRA
jgi:Hemolysins and related proteins containing CBS domains